MKKPLLSIIICTYNRCEILNICLEYLIAQCLLEKQVDLLVIDNNSSDETKKVVEKHQKKYAPLYYYLEPKQGLSHARNSGYLAAKGDWVGYIDDDALIEKDFLKETILTIKEGRFDVFGGKITPWFKYGQPRWLKDDFEVNITPNTQKGLISPFRIYGGAMFFNKQILQDSGGFSPDFGMKGNKIAYGEETHLILNMETAGAKIGINPAVIVRHLVAKRKLKLWWHIKARYANGRDAIYLSKYPVIIKIFYGLSFGLLFTIGEGLKCFVREKDFFLENYFLLVMTHISFTIGQLVRFLSIIKIGKNY